MLDNPMSKKSFPRPNTKKYNFDGDSDTLFITFQCRWPKDSPYNQPFAFINASDSLGVKILGVVDLHQCYYMGNFYDENGEISSSNVQSHVEYFRGIVKESGCTNIVTMGASMGGHAAMMFGVLLNVNHIIAINPQTFLKSFNAKHGLWTPKHRPRFHCKFSNENKDLVNNAIKINEVDVDEYGDVFKLDYKDFTGEMQFHHGGDETWRWHDMKYRLHILCCSESVELKYKRHRYGGKHGELGKHLRDTGKLDKILKGVMV